MKPAAKRPPDLSRLSRRELQVLRLLAEGLQIKEAAARMGITAKTADNHCTHIRAKLDLHGALALHDYAQSVGCAIQLSDPKLK